MTTAADGDEEALRSGEVDGRDDIAGFGAIEDSRRPLIDHAIPNSARLVIARIVRKDQIAANRLPEPGDIWRLQRRLGTVYKLEHAHRGIPFVIQHGRTGRCRSPDHKYLMRRHSLQNRISQSLDELNSSKLPG
ncbi:hypothetical protein [Mesorhizobium sp. M0185]|uniref:hypothetical protein n=1 Tax=unclassified Mesorhizobium TaxID=325217 RepID=UPI00333CA476